MRVLPESGEVLATGLARRLVMGDGGGRRWLSSLGERRVSDSSPVARGVQRNPKVEMEDGSAQCDGQRGCSTLAPAPGRTS